MAFSLIHDATGDMSEALTDSVCRTLLRFIELARHGDPVTRPGAEEIDARIIEAAAQELFKKSGGETPKSERS